MEEETQMQDDMLVEEAPKTMPLEEHTTSSSVKEINPKTSKWLWFIVVMVVVLVSFAVAWFIIQENDRLSSDIEFGAVTHSEKLTNKAIKGIGDTLSEAKDLVAQNGDANHEFSVTKNIAIKYPEGWHAVALSDGLKHLAPWPISLAETEDSGGLIMVTQYQPGKVDEAEVLPELLEMIEEQIGMKIEKQEEFTSDSGEVGTLRLEGFVHETGAPADSEPTVPTVMHLLVDEEDGIWYAYPRLFFLAALSEEDREMRNSSLDEMMKSLHLIQ